MFHPFSKNCTFHENIKISWLKESLRILQEDFKTGLKPMTENLQEKLHHGERKQLKGAKILQNFLQNIWKIKYAKSNNTLVTLRAFLNQLKTFI